MPGSSRNDTIYARTISTVCSKNDHVSVSLIALNLLKDLPGNYSCVRNGFCQTIAKQGLYTQTKRLKHYCGHAVCVVFVSGLRSHYEEM